MADIKQNMPKGASGQSTNPPATTGGGGAPTNDSRTSDAKQNGKQGWMPKDPAKGNNKNGDFSQ